MNNNLQDCISLKNLKAKDDFRWITWIFIRWHALIFLKLDWVKY